MNKKKSRKSLPGAGIPQEMDKERVGKHPKNQKIMPIGKEDGRKTKTHPEYFESANSVERVRDPRKQKKKPESEIRKDLGTPGNTDVSSIRLNLGENRTNRKPDHERLGDYGAKSSAVSTGERFREDGKQSPVKRSRGETADSELLSTGPPSPKGGRIDEDEAMEDASMTTDNPRPSGETMKKTSYAMMTKRVTYSNALFVYKGQQTKEPMSGEEANKVFKALMAKAIGEILENPSTPCRVAWTGFKDGYGIIPCEDAETAKWVKGTIAALHIDGIRFRAWGRNEEPEGIIITSFIGPEYAEYPITTLVNVMKTQEGLQGTCTVRREDTAPKTGRYVKLVVDKPMFDGLMSRGGRVHIGCSTITFRMRAEANMKKNGGE